MKTTIDILTKHQKLLLGIAIFLSLLAVSITIDSTGVNLNLKNYPSIMTLMVAVGIMLVIVYTRIDKYRIENLSHQIESLSAEQKENSKFQLSELTTRQKEVYELIVSGKSNKEIMANLFIEQSTLKSHINQIYKKLNVKNRRELKSNAND
jgi:DNA-binding CsgD family transcriptional regulator